MTQNWIKANKKKNDKKRGRSFGETANIKSLKPEKR